MLLNSFINYYIKLQDDVFYKVGIFIIESDNDSLEVIKKYDFIDNIERVLLFTPNKSYDSLAQNDQIFIDTSGGYTEIAGSSNKNNKLNWSSLERGNYNNSILVLEDKSLLENEIKLGINRFDYNSYKANELTIANTINKKIGFYYQSIDCEFIISDVYSNKLSELKISSELYNK